MESSIGKLIYCCISNHSRILYSYNGGDREIETLASLCIEKAPPFHSHYFHTAGGRSFGFLIDETLTYFAIVDHDRDRSNKRKFLQLLHQIKNSYKRSKNFDDELIPIIKRLICSLESKNFDVSSSNCYGSSSTKAPLLGRSGSVKIDLAAAAAPPPPEAAEGGGAEKSLSLSFSSRNRQIGRKLWWRHVKIVVIADVFLCLVLFGVWLAVCRGFRCLS